MYTVSDVLEIGSAQSLILEDEVNKTYPSLDDAADHTFPISDLDE